MSLERQYISIPFVQGIDSKTDEKFVQPTKLLTLSNGVLTKQGKIIKRNGYDALNVSVLNEDDLDSGEALGTYKDELLLFNQNNVYSRLESVDAYALRGAVSPLKITSKTIVSNSAAQTAPDFAINSGIAVYAWKDSRGGVRATVIDTENNATIQSDVVINSTSTSNYPRVVALGGYIYVFYVVTGSTNIKYRRLVLSDPTVFEADVTLPSVSINSTNQVSLEI